MNRYFRNPRFHKYFWICAVVHVVVILFLFLVPWIRGLLTPKTPQEIITFVDLQAPPPTPVPEQPVISPLVEPEPLPESLEEKIPEPKLKTVDDIKKSKKKIRREEKEKKPKQKQKSLSEEELKKLLSTQASSSKSKPDDFPAWYYALVRQAMYEAWKQPSGLSGADGISAAALVRVHQDGSISRRRLVRASGNALMDESVEKALQAVSRLKPLPSQFRKAYKEITIQFELSI